MRLTRTYLDAPLAVADTVMLPEPAFAHLIRVLRLSAGDACVLFNGDGHDYTGQLCDIGKRSATVIITTRTAITTESALNVHLLQAIARGEKMDWIVQKATELGVAAICPVFTERTEVRLDADRGDKRMAHWRGVITSACEQSGRARLPQLDIPQSLSSYIANCQCLQRLVLDPEANTSIRGLDLSNSDSVALAIGPEGGFSERDLATLDAAGFTRVRAGPRILRTETAGLAAIAALQACWGDW